MNYRNALTAGLFYLGTIVMLNLTLSACAPVPTQYESFETSLQPAPLATRVYFYPDKGQSAYQQDFDHYQCYLWAVKQTGFDPSRPYLAPHQRLEVVPHPPAGQDTVIGTAAGAIIGAAVAPHDKTVTGAVVGAAAGAILGSVSDAARQERIERIQREYAEFSDRKRADLERQAAAYRRAMAACLEGRGYTVQ